MRFDCGSTSEEESAVAMDPVLYYENDPELPIFSTVSTGYPASELANILMAKNIDIQRVCRIQPLGVTKTATFVVDLDDVLFGDLKADDLGTWNAKGTKSTHFTMSPNGVVRIASGRPSRSMKSSYYTLTRRYYTHGTYKLFRRIVIDIRGMFIVYSLIVGNCLTTSLTNTHYH